MTERASCRRIIAAAAALAGLSAVAVFGASISMTVAQRQASQFVATEFTATVPRMLNLEGSTDGGVTWAEQAALSFTPDELALKIGAENAVFAPVQVRAGEGANSAAQASITVSGLSEAAFAASLQGAIYEDVPAANCDAAGVDGMSNLAKTPALRGQESTTFAIAKPMIPGDPGPVTDLCVQVWLNENNWLIGGQTSLTETATWTVTGTSL